MAERNGLFRTRHKLKGKPLYAIRDKKGRFVDIQDIKKAMKGERLAHARTKVKPGQGFRGDTK